MSDTTDILIQSYYNQLNNQVVFNMTAIPVYSKFVDSVETADCYVLISDVSGNMESAKQTRNESASISIMVSSKNSLIDPDKVMGLVDSLILDVKNNCLIQMPPPYQTWIDNYTSNSQAGTVSTQCPVFKQDKNILS